MRLLVLVIGLALCLQGCTLIGKVATGAAVGGAAGWFVGGPAGAAIGAGAGAVAAPIVF